MLRAKKLSDQFVFQYKLSLCNEGLHRNGCNIQDGRNSQISTYNYNRHKYTCMYVWQSLSSLPFTPPINLLHNYIVAYVFFSFVHVYCATCVYVPLHK